MTYRFARQEDLPGLLNMVEQAKASFKARGIGQWQKGDPDGPGLSDAISRGYIHVLEQDGAAVGMVTIIPGPEASYAVIDGNWLNDEPYVAFHRVCVEESCKGRGLAAQLFARSEEYAGQEGYSNIRVDTHPDNISMQRALEKSGYICCGRLVLTEGTEIGDPRLAYHKVLSPDLQPEVFYS